ncbi:GTP cyclohydrolase I FolE [Rhizobium leguminosarum]|uniref:GTP cyclohydrolase I FolE n=1 Tax=Rhizobium leguminosarum TaxID=384 RepID=UPI0016191DB5|nr:GTP cyclohydrolase I FolE [Rhizobium leguminosarum]MBB4342989.1 GTP cyclohydrolase I [Rhizobium leguminosarum]MBB6296067.1 GTP cyclohydrolase I [Rhizobium leguminosarum]
MADLDSSSRQNRVLSIEKSVRDILIAIGEDPNREGLADTPARVAKMYMEVFSGLAEDPSNHFETTFSADQHEDMVIVKDITFYSMCEHHLLPFFGRAHIAYLPEDGRLAGLSKVARLVRSVARKPQLQERLSTQCVEILWKSLRPRGVLAVVEAEHLCMAMRGVNAPGSTTVTVVSRGEFEKNSALREEALRLLRS